VAVAVYAGLTFLRRTPLGLALQGVRDSDARMRSLGHDVTALRITAFAVSGLVAGLAGVLAVWFNGQISPGAVDLQRTIDLLVVAVIGGLYRLEGAFVGALAVTLLANFAGDVTGRVNTLIGACFVLVLVASPGGLVGAAGRGAALLRRHPHAPAGEPMTAAPPA
jgi:branched-chain amino acid transport system permease protein